MMEFLTWFCLIIGIVFSIAGGVLLLIMFVSWCVNRILKHKDGYLHLYDYARNKKEFKAWKKKDK